MEMFLAEVVLASARTRRPGRVGTVRQPLDCGCHQLLPPFGALTDPEGQRVLTMGALSQLVQRTVLVLPVGSLGLGIRT